MKLLRTGFPLRVASLYAIIAGVWILLSDRLIIRITTDPIQLTFLQTYKGWGYVLVTAGALYLFLRYEWTKLQREIQARQAVETALQESQTWLIAAQRMAKMGDFSWDLETGAVTWSESLFDLMGYDKFETFDYARINAQIHHPEDLDRVTRWIEDCIASGKETLVPNEYRVIRKDGEILFVRTVGVVQHREGKKPRIFATLQDITERRRAESALQKSEERFRMVSSIISDVVYSCKTDENGSFSLNWMTGALERISGYSIDEMISYKCWHFLVVEEDLHLFERNVTGLTPGAHGSCDLRVRHKNGSIVWVASYAKCIMGSETPEHLLLYGGLTDITEHKRAEEENEKLQARLVQSQKMEAIGTLAGGIAHDFNNILSAIFGYTELALMKIETETEIKADLKEVLLGAERAKDLVKQILAFSRQSQKELMPVQMGLIAKEALKLLRSSLPTTIEIRQNILSKSIVFCDSTQLHQIVMNLCTNAAHAMQANGGVLEVTLTDAALNSDFCISHPEIQPGAYLKLSVSDTGCGMTADVMNRIFDPFFTTKPKDEGTGLGLSVVHGIVKDCGGTIAVYSEPDKGAAFNLYFPIIAGRAEEKSEEHKIIPTGTERILVVDDEKAISDIIQKNLTSLGYTVQARTSSLEALELFKAMPDKFNLVITDMTMPQMTGDALARKLMKIRPDVPVILCTGFSEKMTNEKAETVGIKAFLQKPLLKAEMAHTIRRVLDEIKG